MPVEAVYRLLSTVNFNASGLRWRLRAGQECRSVRGTIPLRLNAYGVGHPCDTFVIMLHHLYSSQSMGDIWEIISMTLQFNCNREDDGTCRFHTVNRPEFTSTES